MPVTAPTGQDLSERGQRLLGAFPGRAADAFIVGVAHEHPQAGVPLRPFPVQGERGRPKARRMLTETTPTQQRLAELFDLDRYAPRR